MILREHEASAKFEQSPEELRSLIKSCLTISVAKRPTAKQLIDSPLFDECKRLRGDGSNISNGSSSQQHQYQQHLNGFDMFATTLRCQDLEITNIDRVTLCDDPLSERSIQEVGVLSIIAQSHNNDIYSRFGRYGTMVLSASVPYIVMYALIRHSLLRLKCSEANYQLPYTRMQCLVTSHHQASMGS